MLTVDFYESGVGETIVITFPNGGIGIVDAAPPNVLRPPLINLAHGRHIHFVCLTHPHLDHGEDMVDLLRSGAVIDEFWHTVTNLEAFVYQSTEMDYYPAAVSAFAESLQAQWAKFLIRLYGAVIRRNQAGMPIRQIHAQYESVIIDGVELFFLSPEDQVAQEFAAVTVKRSQGEDVDLPDVNNLSAILYLKYGDCAVLLCSDAPKKAWVKASDKMRRKNLGPVQLIKVPHHGSDDGLNFRSGPRQRNYLENCRANRETMSVLFAGDAKHPSMKVYEKLKEKTRLFCVSNGLKVPIAKAFGLEIGEAVEVAPPCLPHIHVEMQANGTLASTPPAACNLCV